MRNKVSRVFWGIFFIACASFVILNQMGMWTYKLGFWPIVGTIIFSLSLIDGIINRRITEWVFSIAFLLMIFAQPLKITRLVPWTILFAAVLISIGLSIIFRNRFHTIVYANKKIKNFREKRENFSNNIFTETVSNDNGAHVVIDQSLSDASRYIHSKELETIAVNAKMGDINIYLDDAEALGDVVTMTLNVTMTEINIYLPSTWGIENNINPMMSSLETKGLSNGGGPKLIIQGRANMSSVNINYI